MSPAPGYVLEIRPPLMHLSLLPKGAMQNGGRETGPRSGAGHLGSAQQSDLRGPSISFLNTERDDELHAQIPCPENSKRTWENR